MHRITQPFIDKINQSKKVPTKISQPFKRFLVKVMEVAFLFQ